jgi:hypothetical protein
MKKYIKAILLVRGQKAREVQFDTTDNLHEMEIYTILEQMFPAYIFVNPVVDHNIYQEGYNVEFKNGLVTVAIYRSNP